jgi:lipoprotein-anchoring transpeptidase ErfK/SrfK
VCRAVDRGVALHTAPRPNRTIRRRPIGWVIAGAVGAVATAIVVIGLPAAPAAAPAPTPDAAAVARLPIADTYATIPAAPLDGDAAGRTDGVVVHPPRSAAVYAAPGGVPIARVDPTGFGDTWLPVIATQGDWMRVLLPSRPNASTGWLRGADVRMASTPYVVKVHLRSFRMELVDNGAVVGAWTVGTGKASAPTPAGRTFLLGALKDTKQHYSPVILPLGTHSPTHDTFGGGPGTVAIHTWPTANVFGTASSDGCIRVPSDALDRLTEVPLGTLVMIDEG